MKYLKVSLVAALLAFVLTVPAMASYEERYVSEGDYFEIPLACECVDPDVRNINMASHSNCVELRSCSVYRSSVQANLKAVSSGTAVLNFQCQGCGRSTECIVHVEGAPAPSRNPGLNFEQSRYSLKSGEGLRLSAYWDPGVQVDLQWSSSDSSVVSIDSSNSGTAYLAARNSGSARITVRDRISGDSATCTVTVEAKDNWRLVISSQPRSASYRLGESAQPLTVDAYVMNPDGQRSYNGITYQWYYGNGRDIRGAQSSSFIPSTYEAGNTYYYCVVTYAIGSVDLSETSSTAMVSVKGEEYTMTLEADKSSFIGGNNIGLTAYIYDANGNTYTGGLTVNWEITKGYNDSSLANSYNYTDKRGRASNTLYTNRVSSSTTVKVTASVYINGRTYSDSVSVTVKPEAANYGFQITSDSSKLFSGQTTMLYATITRNGSPLTNSSPEVKWTISDTSKSRLQTTKSTYNTYTKMAENSLTENGLSTSYVSDVVVTASVTLDGKQYTSSVTISLEGRKSTKIILTIGSCDILVDGTYVKNDVAPCIVNSRTMVPIRVITNLLGGEVQWNNQTKTATLSIDGKIIHLVEDQVIPGYGVAPLRMYDRLFVPVKFVADQLGVQCDWNPATYQVTITK